MKFSLKIQFFTSLAIHLLLLAAWDHINTANESTGPGDRTLIDQKEARDGASFSVKTPFVLLGNLRQFPPAWFQGFP